MGRKATPQSLTLTNPNSLVVDRDLSGAGRSDTALGLSPANSRSPTSQRSSPYGDRYAAPDHNAATAPRPQTAKAALQPAATAASGPDHSLHYPQSARDPPATSFPPISSAFNSPSSAGPPQHGLRYAQTEGKKPTRSGFFSFNKTSKPASPEPYTQAHARTFTGSRDQIMSRGPSGISQSNQGDSPFTDEELQRPIPAFPSLSDLSLSSNGDQESGSASSPPKRSKPKSFGLLGRSRSIRDKDQASPKSAPIPLPPAPSIPSLYDSSSPLRTAPVVQERSFRDMMNSSVRNRSEDRAMSREGPGIREYARDGSQRFPTPMRDNGSSNFLSGLRNSSTRAADMISKGLFGKSTRSGSTTEKETVVDDEHYVLKVINLPLVDQTRKTRISKRLENSRDKTEFWMPAFPWRAIDYLNYKGCDVEGLYRVPGSGPQVKKWQRRFDELYDVNLFEADDLYDINIIGSMLKAWLRELPDELFPKDAQDRINRECTGDEEAVPQILIDELSNLSPFNYYLLFAITCHLSLLLAHSDKNKMDFRNLCICFQPCMKIDAFCFKFLVCDWRECWKGCKQEAKYIEEEYKLFDQPPPRGLTEPQSPAEGEDEPGRTSSDSFTARDGKAGTFSNNQSRRRDSQSSISTNMSSHTGHEANSKSNDMRPLSPIQPLSPIGF